MAAIAESDLAGLSDAERAAMADADDSELNSLQGAGVQDFNEASPDNPDDPDEVPDEVPAVAQPAAAAPDPAPVAQVDPSEREFVPTFNAPAVEDFDAKIATLVAEETALREKLSNGDIDISNYDAEKTRIIEARADLRADQRLADFAAQQNESNNKARWQWEQERFFEQDTSAIYKDPLLFAALDAAVKAAAHIPENSKRSSGWFLAQADIQVRKLFNPAAPAGAAAPAASVPTTGKPAITLVKPGPTTLASLPSAELPETGGGDEFARLEKLTGMALERQLSRMTPDEVDRYLRAA